MRSSYTRIKTNLMKWGLSTDVSCRCGEVRGWRDILWNVNLNSKLVNIDDIMNADHKALKLTEYTGPSIFNSLASNTLASALLNKHVTVRLWKIRNIWILNRNLSEITWHKNYSNIIKAGRCILNALIQCFLW